MEEIMDYINLKKRKEVFKLGIIDEEGQIIKDEQGNEIVLEFDLGDIELPLKYNRCINEINLARSTLKRQLNIIRKKQDHKGKQLLSSNEELKIKAMKEFYRDMEKAMDLFLGEGGTKKFLNGKSPYREMFDDLSEAIEPFLEKMKISVSDMTARIKNKYKIKESDILIDE